MAFDETPFVSRGYFALFSRLWDSLSQTRERHEETWTVGTVRMTMSPDGETSLEKRTVSWKEKQWMATSIALWEKERGLLVPLHACYRDAIHFTPRTINRIQLLLVSS